MAHLPTPTRTLHNPRDRRLVGQPSSHKNGGAVPWEPLLERDAEVVFDDGRIAYAEAKRTTAACKPEWQARQYAATESLQAAGHDLMVLTEHDLRPGHWAQNIRILYPYADHPKFEGAKGRIPEILGGAARVEIAQVRETANLLSFDAVEWRTHYTCATPDSAAQCRP